MIKKRKAIAILLSTAMVFCYTPGSAFAATQPNTEGGTGAVFVDMPTDWSSDGLNRAVSNGLLGGYDTPKGKEIRPQGNLTRAEMATVINRAFGATEKTSLSGVTDVQSNAWYADEMAKAVKMKTFAKDTVMRPNDKITRQEAFTVIARAFKIEDKDGSQSLNKFTDKAQIASWAAGSICAMSENGYITGNGGAINPKANITRAEFAKIMDNIVKSYIHEAGNVTATAEGNVMINVPGVTMTGTTVKGDLIIGDGVGNGEITLDGVTVEGRTLVRGGGVNSVIITGNSNIKNLIVSKVDGNVRVAVQGNGNVDVISIADGKDNVIVEGKVKNITVGSSVPVVLKNATVGTVTVDTKDSNLTVDKDSKVETVTVNKEAQGTKVAVAGTVTSLKSEAPKTNLAVTGTLKSVTIEATATGTNVDIAKEAKVDNLKNDAKGTTTSGEGKPANTTGSEEITNKDSGASTKPEDKPATGGGSGGSGGGQEQESTLLDVTLTPNTVHAGDKIYAEVSFGGAQGSVDYEWYSSLDGESLGEKLVGNDPVYQTDPVYNPGGYPNYYVILKVTPKGSTKGTEKTSNPVRIMPAQLEYTANKDSDGNMVITFTKNAKFPNIENAQPVEIKNPSWVAIPGLGASHFSLKIGEKIENGALQAKVSGENQLTISNKGITGDCTREISFSINNYGYSNGSFYLTIKNGEIKEQIVGSVSIEGIPKVGSTVTAVPNITSPNPGAIKYNWLGMHGTGASEEMKATYADQTCAVEVTAENYSGKLISNSFTIEKADYAGNPATMPTLKTATKNSIELEDINVAPMEYAISHVGGVALSAFDWQKSPKFENLVTAKKYKFVSRVNGLQGYLPSVPSVPSEAFVPLLDVQKLTVNGIVMGQAWYKTNTDAAMSFEVHAKNEKGESVNISDFGKMIVKCMKADGSNEVLGELKEGMEFYNAYDRNGQEYNTIYAYMGSWEGYNPVLKGLAQGDYALEFSNESSEAYGYKVLVPFKVYANGSTLTYNQPANGTMKLLYADTEISTGGILNYNGVYSHLKLEASINAGYRIKDVTIQDASRAVATSINIDEIQELIRYGRCEILPLGDATITVITEQIPSDLPKITGIKAYTGMGVNRVEITNPSTEGITLGTEEFVYVELEPTWSTEPTGIFTNPYDIQLIYEGKYIITEAATAPSVDGSWNDEGYFSIDVTAQDKGKYCHTVLKGDGKYFANTPYTFTLKIN